MMVRKSRAATAPRTPRTRGGRAGPVEEGIVAMLTGGDPRGCTPDELADALGLAPDGGEVQRTLEALVARRRLARWGIGRGALYTLPAPPVRGGGAHGRAKNIALRYSVGDGDGGIPRPRPLGDAADAAAGGRPPA